jgi:hypothetical protein
MQRVKCDQDTGTVLKKTIKSIARILFGKIMFLFDEQMRGGSWKAKITRHAYLVVYIDVDRECSRLKTIIVKF